MNARSKLTTHEGFLPDVDMRSSWARRFRDAVALHASDMGGSENLTEAQRSIIRRMALIQTELEFSEMKIAQAREDDHEPGGIRLDRYRQMSETLRRLAESLGLHAGRHARDVTPRGDQTARVIDGLVNGRYAGAGR
ncbi:MAG: hypothetical protein E5V71_05055 [Mesorhizobium sp.]|nr:MAG: hypothetical protein E5V71_05055 [Mesorhizobium sp.]